MSKILTLAGIVLLGCALTLLVLQQKNNLFQDRSNRELITIPPAEPIITQVAATKECTIQVTTSGETIFLPTAFDPTIAKCEKYVVSTLSPSGMFVAFEDLSSTKIDALVSLYELTSNRVFTLDDFGTESVLDLKFLPNNRLLVLYSQGISGEQKLRLYDLPSLTPLLKDIPSDNDLSSEMLNPYVFERVLDDVNGIARNIRVTEDLIILVDETGDISQPVFSIELSEL